MPNAENRPWPWAKLQRHCKEGRGDRCRAGCDCPVTGALSLIGHSADVAALMRALLGQPTIARRLARLLGQTALTPRDRAQLTALAALHDLGKINHGFQRKPFIKNAHGGHVGPLGALLTKSPAELLALIDGGGLRRLLHLLDQNGELIAFNAILAHHGSLPTEQPMDAALWRQGLPRSRGDRPQLVALGKLAMRAPPLTRGSTRYNGPDQGCRDGSPAHAGIDP